MDGDGRRRRQIEAQRHHAARTGLTRQAPQNENGAEVVQVGKNPQLKTSKKVEIPVPLPEETKTSSLS